MSVTQDHQDFFQWLEQRNPNQVEFNQAVQELYKDLVLIVSIWSAGLYLTQT
ncbi:hypothetical protein [Vibrio pelagius]|uniref:hypothetical protein n=1 Tax=Vibrio pelagius TaxID=28169 RepID=UPI0021C351AD|nr:hypothetical protein [Vibrio pelagius]